MLKENNNNVTQTLVYTHLQTKVCVTLLSFDIV